MSQQRLDQIFAPEGVLSKVLSPGYERRPQQESMARAVQRTLEYGGALLAEAPTGVGKSLSYLIPALLWAIREEEPVIVSTYTKQLQDQILEKEMPRIRRIIDREFRVVLLKGRTSYLCRNRWLHYMSEVEGTTEGERVVRALSRWVDLTETGDLSEAPKLDYRDMAALGRICGDMRFCATTSRCSPESGCFYKSSRQKAKDAHLVVINHALLLSDIFGAGGGVPPFESIIIDEAHHLPHAATEPLTYTVSEKSLEAAIKSLGGRGEPGVTEEIRKVARVTAGKVTRNTVLERVREIESETALLGSTARNFWNELAASDGFPRGGQRLRYTPSERTIFPEVGLDLCNGLRSQVGKVTTILEQMSELSGDGGGRTESLAIADASSKIDQLQQQISQLEELLTPTDRNRVYWIEPESPSGIVLKTAPLTVGPELRERFFQKKAAVVLTSATLAVRGNFSHIATSLGLVEDKYESLVLESPFSLTDQVQSWVHTGHPDPNQPNFHDELATGIVDLVWRLKRKMLVLFTSHDALRRVAERIREPLEARGIRMLAQGLGAGRSQLRAEFVTEGPAVLLGAASFWEGVDFPGEELEILIMARLPFLVPTDPLVQARGERAEAEGRDAFSGYYLPEALIRFRQGFGRLIRRRGDRGLFIVVDPRLHQKSYGRQFRGAVGVPFQTGQTWEEIGQGGEQWFFSGGDPVL